MTARPESEWHEDIGAVVWWFFPFTMKEPAWIGTPLDDGWPGYHTHFTPHPPLPEAPPLPPEWPDFRVDEVALMGVRQSGYCFFTEGFYTKKIACYPGSADEQDARQKFAR